MTIERTTVMSIEQLDDYDDEYVYDVGMTNGDNNWFFGNGILVKNTDSAKHDTKVDCDGESVEIGKLFQNSITSAGDIFHINDSEYVFVKDKMSRTYDPSTQSNIEKEIDYIYRHKVEKEMFEIEDEDGNIVVVTDDHSVMIERDGEFMEMKPSKIIDSDLLIGI